MNSCTTEITKGPHSIRCCPFCSGGGHLTFCGLTPTRYGIQCRNCGASVPARHASHQDAIRAWNRRSGLAMLGGRATKGLRSRRKLAAARRNLKTARQWKLIRQRVETAYTAIKPYREKQLAETEAAIAADRAWLKEREPLILANPVLRTMYESLTKRDAPAQTEYSHGVPGASWRQPGRVNRHNRRSGLCQGVR
jgi:hypothetical protein